MNGIHPRLHTVLTLLLLFLSMCSTHINSLKVTFAQPLPTVHKAVFIGYNLLDYSILADIAREVNISVDYVSPCDLDKVDLCAYDLIVVGLLKRTRWDYIGVSGEEFQRFKTAGKPLLFIGESGAIINFISEVKIVSLGDRSQMGFFRRGGKIRSDTFFSSVSRKASE